MTGLTGCAEIRHALGVYVVGAIDPAERAALDAHLGGCPDCREELAGLAGLPALLGRVSIEDAERFVLRGDEPEEPPAELLDSLLRQVAGRRRARRWRAIAAAAAAAIIAVGGGIVGGAVISRAHRPSGHTPGQQYESYLARGTDPATHVAAAVYYHMARSGTAMQVQVTGIPDGTRCEFWVMLAGGRHLAAATWTVNGTEGSNWYAVSSPAATASVRGFDLTGPGGRVLVTIPRSSSTPR